MTTQPARTPLQPTCEAELGMRCAHTAEGHKLHPMRRRLAAATPSRWADAIVTRVGADSRIDLLSVETGATVAVWHHENLGERISVGEPVALHTTYHVLAIGSHWLSVSTDIFPEVDTR